MSEPEVKIEAKGIYKLFGPRQEKALKLLDEGERKEEIMEKTGATVGVADVSFKVYTGETLVFMGLSGSGKSTLIRCINRLIEPTRGDVLLDGESVLELDQEELRKLRRTRFGMVFQNFALFPHRSVLKNAEFGLEVQGVDPEERRKKAEEALDLVGLKGWEDTRPAQLSGGMQQRVGLARALAVEPDIMLMDEAFSALDPLIRRDMQNELLSLQDRVRKTIVFITHDLNEALRVGDRIVLLKAGRVIQTGTPEEILTSPATEYVERFVEDVDKSRVLTASAVMRSVREVAFPGDGPRTALHKMKENSLSSIFVVEHDQTLKGLVRADAMSRAAKRGEKKITDYMEKVENAASPDEPLNNLINLLSDTDLPLPVIDESGKLKGVVIKGSLLAGLAEGGGNNNGEQGRGGREGGE